MIYFLIPVCLLIGVLLVRRRWYWTAYYWFCCGVLVLLAGLRWETGTDWLPYYIDYSQPGVRPDFEAGYVLLVTLFSRVTSDYTIFLLFTALVTLILIFYTCYRLNGISFATILLFYCYYYLGNWLGGERRQYAIGLCFLALVWIIERRPWLFLGTVLLAGAFHVSSLIFLPAYWLYRMRNKTLLISAGCIGAAGLLVAVAGFDRLFGALSRVLPVGFVAVKLIAYFAGTGGEAPPTLAAIIGGFLKRAFVLGLLWLVTRKHKQEMDAGLLRLYAASVALYVLSMLTVPMLSVMTLYYSIVEIVLIARAFSVLRVNRVALTAALILYSTIQIASILGPYWNLYVPYYSILERGSRQVQMY